MLVRWQEAAPVERSPRQRDPDARVARGAGDALDRKEVADRDGEAPLEARRERWDASYIVFQGFDGTTMEAMARST